MGAFIRARRDSLLKRLLGPNKVIRRAILNYASSKHLEGLLIRDKNNNLFSIAADDGVIGYSLLLSGGWQYDELYQAISAFKKKQNKPSVFFDIGAHIGTQLVTAMKTNEFVKGFGFEMFTETYQHLSRNIILNNLSDRVEVYNKAVSLKPSRYEVKTVLNNKGANSLSDLQAESSASQKTVNLKSFLQEKNFDLSSKDYAKLFWLDVEGLELEVIQSIVSDIDPESDAIALEFNTHLYERDLLAEALDQLFNGFSNCMVLGDKHVNISKQELLDSKRPMDLVFF